MYTVNEVESEKIFANINRIILVSSNSREESQNDSCIGYVLIVIMFKFKFQS